MLTQQPLFAVAPISSKVALLENLRSVNGKSKYKRYIGTPIRYAGGKSLAVGHIIERLPDGITRLVSPFLGGGSFEVACARELGIEVTAYDIFDILVNFWQELLSDAHGLYEKLKQLSPTKETYAQVKERLKAHWDGEIHLPPLELATLYYFNHNLSYGPGFLGWMSKIYENSGRYESMLRRLRDFSAPSLQAHCLSFEESIPLHNGEFLYCDPPYYLGGDSLMFRGIYPQRNFPIHHKGFDHELLRDLLREHCGGFILSYNDCPTIREWYADFKIVDVSWQYTMGQGETRIGLNRIADNRGHVKKSHEILIASI
ncbi:MAG: DNA adenine methylase [Chloroflexi bacterium]|nr:DNA adenine methylase [Chloroflexota bacterium]MCY3581540.1 DNA adenine methylase [Chloroflexota bacterium]MCY3716747.1 DNA adenine methylase [Chloroflexota bacterium]MDE2651089.1 DNA adenine methylase [Chloroflexota bacterium]MXX49810.1 DNA adenine methylase [Chloroflexota bacterium]